MSGLALRTRACPACLLALVAKLTLLVPRTAEDNVRKACADIIHDAVMVGTGRTLPAFVVEVDSKGTPLSADQKASIAQTVVERIADYNKRVFGHERVDDPKRVLVVEKGTLPRTKEKGNVR